MARSDEEFQHGKKRPADGDPDGAQPLTKRFGRLQLDNDGSISGARASRVGSPDPGSSGVGDAMLLDDTKYTTYIHNLDQELAGPDPCEEGLVFSPLAAKMISVPESLLSTSTKGKELVLYRKPSPLSVPKEQDSARRAILDPGARAKAEATRSQSPRQSDDAGPLPLSRVILDTFRPHNGDPMDIDLDG